MNNMNLNNKNKTFCTNCLKETSFKIVKEKEERIVLGVKIEVEIETPYCDECGSAIDVPSVERRNSIVVCDAYRRKEGLLTSEEILGLRKKYRLSATALSKLIGAGEKTVTRYENGSIQDATHDRILRLLDDTSVFESLYERYKKDLSLSERGQVEEALAIQKSTSDVLDDEALRYVYSELEPTDTFYPISWSVPKHPALYCSHLMSTHKISVPSDQPSEDFVSHIRQKGKPAKKELV